MHIEFISWIFKQQYNTEKSVKLESNRRAQASSKAENVTQMLIPQHAPSEIWAWYVGSLTLKRDAWDLYLCWYMHEFWRTWFRHKLWRLASGWKSILYFLKYAANRRMKWLWKQKSNVITHGPSPTHSDKTNMIVRIKASKNIWLLMEKIWIKCNIGSISMDLRFSALEKIHKFQKSLESFCKDKVK